MVASIVTAAGRLVSRSAGPKQVAAALVPGVKVAGVLMSGRGRLVQGRFREIDAGRVRLDGEAETLAMGDICFVRLNEGVADNDRKNPTG